MYIKLWPKKWKEYSSEQIRQELYRIPPIPQKERNIFKMQNSYITPHGYVVDKSCVCVGRDEAEVIFYSIKLNKK